MRKIVLDCKLTEELKWGCPCYTSEGSNIVLIHGFKDYCALLFIKGALMRDAKGILIQQTENVQAARQIRFTNLNEIVKLKTSLKVYINEAIAIEKIWLESRNEKPTEFKMAEEFQQVLNEMSEVKKAFEALTSGRQRAYLLHFSQPKQSKTRESRVENCIPQILKRKGLND